MNVGLQRPIFSLPSGVLMILVPRFRHARIPLKYYYERYHMFMYCIGDMMVV